MTAQEIEEYLAGPDVERQRQLDIATLDAEHNVIVGWNAAIDAAVAHLNKNGIEHNAVEISLMKK
jgi:hypothetical protein